MEKKYAQEMVEKEVDTRQEIDVQEWSIESSTSKMSYQVNEP